MILVLKEPHSVIMDTTFLLFLVKILIIYSLFLELFLSFTYTETMQVIQDH